MSRLALLLCLSTLALGKPVSQASEQYAAPLQQTSTSVVDFLDGFVHGAQNSTTNLCLTSFSYIGNAWDNFKASIEGIGDTLDDIVPAISYLRFWADAVRDNVTNCKYSILLRLWFTLLDPANLAEYTIKYLTDQTQYNEVYENLLTSFFNGDWYGVGYAVGAGFSLFTNFAY